MRTYIAGILLVVASASLVIAQADPPELLSFSDSAEHYSAASRVAVQVRRIRLNRAALQAAERSMRLTLFDGVSREIVMQSVERRGAEDVAWRGNFAGSQGQVMLTLRRGFVAGLLYAPDGVYEIATVHDGGQVLTKVDQSRYPPCATQHDGLWVALSEPSLDDVCTKTLVEPDAVVTIDVMVLYTAQARQAAGGDQPMLAQIQGAVDVANSAFMNSEMHARLRLVHADLASRSETGIIEDDLAWLQGDPDVAQLRDRFGADMVSLFVEDGGGFCGRGYEMEKGHVGPEFANWAFQVTARWCAIGNLTYAHEHGHNMGLHHNPENGPPASAASCPWSYGHYVDGVFSTVMSYTTQCPSNCTRIPHFSNPDVLWLDHATGIDGMRDNHRTGEITDAIVASFRSQPSTPPPAARLDRANPWLQQLLLP